LTTAVENAGLSEVHAQIKLEGELYMLMDLNSETGTWINVQNTIEEGQ
jgi:pSer/pThr/pTyr-binding forkhead associated (FHA) protein